MNTPAKEFQPASLAMLHDFVLDIVMIAKNRGLTYREGMAGMHASVKLMRGLADGVSEQEGMKRLNALIAHELGRSPATRVVWDHSEVAGIELLNPDVKFVRVGGVDYSVDCLAFLSCEMKAGLATALTAAADVQFERERNGASPMQCPRGLLRCNGKDDDQ